MTACALWPPLAFAPERASPARRTSDCGHTTKTRCASTRPCRQRSANGCCPNYKSGASMRADNGQFLKGHHWRQQYPYWDAEWLRAAYETYERSTGDIASQAGTTDAAIIYWLKKHGIARRTVAQARSVKHWGVAGEQNPMHGKTGAANPRYVDGSSPERQRLYAQGQGREFIRTVLERDRYRCARCASPKKGARSLHVHHRKPWAGNQALRFDLANVVTLCRPCHHWVHSKKNEKREFLA